MSPLARASGGGRKPTPTNLKVLRGNPGKRPLNKAEPKAQVVIPTPPRELPERARKEWRRLAKTLHAAGLITELDRLAFAALVQSYTRWIEAQEGLAKTGMLIRGKDGIPHLNPLLRVSRDAQAEYTRMLTEFGLTPSSRSRMHVESPAEKDDFEEFFGS